MTSRCPYLRFAVLVFAAACCSPSGAAERLASGQGRFEFSGWDGPALPVWYHAPASLNPATPVVFVMHGTSRNADDYRDQWSGLAERYGFLLLVPEFSDADFPERAGYNFGNVFAPDGTRRPTAQWGYTAIERIFDHVRAAAGLNAATYNLYGHSAGAQFAHRMPLFLPSARISRLVTANAGAYMLPDFSHDFPYGLKGSGITEAELKGALRQPVVVLLGEADIDPEHRSIPRAPEARAQGLHRFARGLGYFKLASEQAVRLGVPFGWRLVTVPGVGHSNTNMAAFAAEQLFGK